MSGDDAARSVVVGIGVTVPPGGDAGPASGAAPSAPAAATASRARHSPPGRREP
ncbi:hypothetical protein [Pseudonocardia sp.]|uniref:hypothetical protein n=1 Tax=Pseudonocardia sp. TaxID=60912 RepID=UPI0031FC77DB